MDLTRHTAAPEPVTAGEAATTTAAAVAGLFQGVLNQLKLPVDLAVDGLELEGVVIFPGAPGQPPGRVNVSLRGGQLGANREGLFTFAAQVGLTDPAAAVNALNVRGTLHAVMDTPRTLSRVALRLDAEAAGPALPQGVQLTADVSAARVPGGESYTLNVQSVGKRLVDLQAHYPENSARLGGVWKLDVRDTDVAPFALGRPLPSFEAVGAGMFETDTAFTTIHAAGRLKSSADRLAIFVPEFASIGALAVFGEFDLTLRGATTRIDKLVLNVNRPEPVLAVQSLQPFEFNPSTGELKVADPAADLLAIDVQGLPVRWLAPFVADYTLTGGQVRGELRAGAGAGGLVVRTQSPLLINGLSLAEAGRPLVSQLDLALQLSADYSPQGWQADLKELQVRSGGVDLLNFSARAGWLVGEPGLTKVTGRWSAALPALLQQPVLQDSAVLSKGTLQGEFTGSLGLRHKVQATLRLSDLAVPTGEPLPVVTADLRADVAEDGKVTFHLPLRFENQTKGRSSDLTLSGNLVAAGGTITTDARLGSEEIFIEDVQILAALAGAETPDAGPDAPEDKPFWSGLNGRLALALKKLHYNDQFEVSDVNGMVRITDGELKLDGIRAGVGEGGVAQVNGGLAFDGGSATPYALAADLAVTDFDPAPFFRAINPGQPATVEGRFQVTSKLTGRAASVADLAEDAQGDFQLTSRGGVFRGLPVSVASKVEGTSKLAAGVAAVGSLLGSVTGRKEYADIASKAQAVAELSRTLSAIPYDQLSLVLTRDDTLAAVLKDFTLISPEVRLTGAGEARPAPGAPLLEGALAMEFKLRARGHTADLFKYLGVLETQPDELGYTACNLPLRVAGTLGSPDTGELNRALTALAVEKSGAGDLLNRLLGGSK